MLVALLSIHQSLALGAIGLLLCALADVRPAMMAVRGRFEKLQQPGQLVEGDEEEIDVLVDPKPEARTPTKSVSLDPSSGSDSLKGPPPLSIKCVKKAANFGMVETTVHDVDDSTFSDSASMTSFGSDLTSEPGSDETDLGENKKEVAKIEATPSFRDNLALVAKKANAAFSPKWNVDRNPVVNFLVLLVGLFNLAWLTISAPITNRQGRKAKAILPTECSA